MKKKKSSSFLKRYRSVRTKRGQSIRKWDYRASKVRLQKRLKFEFKATKGLLRSIHRFTGIFKKPYKLNGQCNTVETCFTDIIQLFFYSTLSIIFLFRLYFALIFFKLQILFPSSAC